MQKYIVTEARNGLKSLSVKYKDSNREVKLHSSFDPVKEAQRNVDLFNKGRSSFIVVSGVALAYHLDLLKKKYPDTKIIAIEKDPEVLDICRNTLPGILSGIAIINTYDDIEVTFGDIELAGFRGISHYIHKPSYQLDPEFYDSLINALKTYLSSRISDLLTRFEFEERWVENVFRNIRHFSDSLNVSELFGRFIGMPGIIVSAGPSLKNNLPVLREIQNKAVIIAVDTSYKILDKYGIEPHFILTLDAQKYSVKHFTGIKNNRSILIADIVSCPSIMNNYPGKKIISTTSKYYQDIHGNTVRETTPVIDWVENYTGRLGDIQSGGSVATSAFDLLLNMGCDPVILIGQDLAYTGREIHCSGTYHNDDWLPGINRMKNLDTINQNVIRKRKIKYVKKYGNNGLIISDFIFDLYKSWFEDSASRVSISVINSTEGGAKIENTEETGLSVAVNIAKNEIPPEKIIDSLMSDKTQKDITNLKKGMKRGYLILQKLITLTEPEIPEDSDIEKINNLFEDDEANLLLNPFMRKSKFYLSRHSFDSEKTKKIMYNEIKASARKMACFFEKSGLVNL